MVTLQGSNKMKGGMTGSTGQHRSRSRFRRLMAYGLMVLAAYGLLQLADRALFDYSPLYPQFMITRDLGNVGASDVATLRKGECASGPIEISRKPTYLLLRCGSNGYSLDRRIFTAQEFMGVRPGREEIRR